MHKRSACVCAWLTLGHAIQHHVNKDVRAGPASAIAVRVAEIKKETVNVFYLHLLSQQHISQ